MRSLDEARKAKAQRGRGGRGGRGGKGSKKGDGKAVQADQGADGSRGRSRGRGGGRGGGGRGGKGRGGKGRGKNKKGGPMSPKRDGKLSGDEAVDVPLAPVKVKPSKSKGTKDGNSKTAKAKADAKSKAKPAGMPKSQATAKAKAKTGEKRGLEKSMEPSAEESGDERPESVHSPIRPKTLFKGSPKKPIFNTPARRVKKADKKAEGNGKGRGKGKKGKAANTKSAHPEASEYLRKNLSTLPNSFARRPIPSGVPALERYCRMVRAFQEQVELELEPGMKCKAEVGFSYILHERNAKVA